MVSQRLVRFCLVGIVNTALDSTIFVLLRLSGLPVFVANLASSSCGITVSLILNTTFTFRPKRLSRQRVAMYVAITLVGLWVVQPLVIVWLSWIDGQVGFTRLLAQAVGHQRILGSLVPKLGSVVVTLIWNYLWYSRMVFTHRPAKE